MNRLNRIATLSALLFLSACTFTSTGASEESSSASSQEESSVRETRNVSYSGTVQTAGISIYMQGTHRLSLTDGKFILLESESVDLNGYVGESAKVFGSIRPTVEGGGMIMRVESIELIVDSSASSSLSSSLTIESSSSTSGISSSLATSVSVESFSSVQSASSVASIISQNSVQSDAVSSSVAITSSLAVSSSQSTTTSSDASASSSGNEARVESMSRQDLAGTLWTQQYCTSHIGFCIPVHKNWWFRSFGTTSSELWHVEISSEPIEFLQDGPIVLRLLTGKNTVTDGSVSVRDGKVVYTKLWLTDQHIEIVADSRLEAAVRYIGTHLELFNPGE